MSMRTLSFLSLGLALAASSSAAPGLQFEAGASYFLLRKTNLDGSANPMWIDEPEKAAPFVAATYPFNEAFGLRLAYHYVDDLHTVAEFGSLPGSQLPIVVWGHFRDDVHVLSLAPEFSWSLVPQLKFAIAPQLNWVASNGVVSYTTNDPTVLLVGPRERDDDGVTLGGSARLIWSLGDRAALSLGYQYIDFDPSFGREAQVISGGFLWTF